MAKLSIQEIVESLKDFSLLEINNLVKEVEKAFNISADFSVGPAQGAGDEKQSDTPTEKNLHLSSAGTNKIAVIKLIREMTGLGLMDAKKMVDSAPVLVKESVSPDQFDELKKKFTDAGAQIEFK